MSFFDMYFEYTKETECPKFYHRWAAISGIGALLGRDYFFQHGHFQVNPNMYTMLIGNPGTRKSTAIKILKQLLVQTGYHTIAADKTTKEKFLLDMAAYLEAPEGENILEQNLFGEGDSDESLLTKQPAECYIAADEFNDFMGNGNIEFISLLGTLWDYSGVYRSRIKTGKSVAVPNPTVSLLGGNTPTNFAMAFPPEIIGQGFLSRLILIYGEPTGKKITFPKAPNAGDTKILVDYLLAVKNNSKGAATLTHGAEKLLDKIYKSWPGLEDYRFESYANRRFTHLLKLCVVCSATRCAREIAEEDVILANTILTHTEMLMPKALGEFGKSKHSDVAHKVMEVLDSATMPIPFKDIFKYVQNDLDKISELADIMKNLQIADKVQVVNGAFLPKRRAVIGVTNDTIDSNLLSEEEKGY
jgi:energy-coupling factor transporter ATP-binding protein EcfA2